MERQEGSEQIGYIQPRSDMVWDVSFVAEHDEPMTGTKQATVFPAGIQQRDGPEILIGRNDRKGQLASQIGSTGQQWEGQHVGSTSWCRTQDI